jgi:hypothetical protein
LSKGSSQLPSGPDAHLHQKEMTISAGAEAPSARMLTRIDWTALFGVSCSALAPPFTKAHQIGRTRDVRLLTNGGVISVRRTDR